LHSRFSIHARRIPGFTTQSQGKLLARAYSHVTQELAARTWEMAEIQEIRQAEQDQLAALKSSLGEAIQQLEDLQAKPEVTPGRCMC